MFDFHHSIKSIMMSQLTIYRMCVEEDEVLFPSNLT